jgi:hypothetical protein
MDTKDLLYRLLISSMITDIKKEKRYGKKTPKIIQWHPMTEYG